MTSINFIELKSVRTFLSEVNEEINTKYIKNYIYTQIQSQNLTLDNTSKIHYTFISKINTYQITVLNTNTNNILLEPYVLNTLYLNKDIQSTDLYICENFFAFYEKGKMIFFKEIKENKDKKDIVTYLNQTFSTQIENIIEVDEQKFNIYKKEYLNNLNSFPKFTYMNKQNNNTALYYLVYLACVIIFFVFYFFNVSNQDNIEISKDIKNIKLEHVKKDYLDLLEKYEDNKKITPTLITLFNLLDKNSIKLINLKIAQNKSSIKIKATTKELLLNFLDFYDENSVINNMRFIKEENCYEMHATIKLHQ